MRVVVLVGLALWGASSFAQDVQRVQEDQEIQGVYIGVGLGRFSYKETFEGVAFKLEDDTDVTKLYGGYRFNDSWAVEVSYAEPGDFRWSNIPVEKGDFTVSTIAWMMHVDLIFVGFGIHVSDLDFPCSCAPKDGAYLTGGAEWDFGRWSFRGQYDWYDSKSTVDTWGLGFGVSFRF